MKHSDLQKSAKSDSAKQRDTRKMEAKSRTQKITAVTSQESIREPVGSACNLRYRRVIE